MPLCYPIILTKDAFRLNVQDTPLLWSQMFVALLSFTYETQEITLCSNAFKFQMILQGHYFGLTRYSCLAKDY